MVEIMNQILKQTIGNATLYCGDSRDVLPTLDTVDAVISDPPNGLDGSSGTINKARGKAVYDGQIESLEEVCSCYVPAITAALKIAKRGAITPGTPHCFEYSKPTDIAAILQPACRGMSKWGRATWQPVLLYGRDPRVGRTIKPLTFQSNGRFHRCAIPCPKPDDVMMWLVDRASLEGETVLNPFMGSGTTGVACAKLGRKFVGIEREPKYFKIACKRIADAYDQPDMFILPKLPEKEKPADLSSFTAA
jgi:site-specific DNA-methyltransferase (adenine-specific)